MGHFVANGRVCVNVKPEPAHSMALVRDIRCLRQDAGLTQSELAELAGYGDTTVAYWERGKTDPTLRRFVDVANALGYDVKLVKREA